MFTKKSTMKTFEHNCFSKKNKNDTMVTTQMLLKQPPEVLFKIDVLKVFSIFT